MSLTPPTAHKEPVYGDLVLVANEGCDASDYPAEVTGNVAFVLRGTCSFGAKSELAGKAGAVAAIVYNYDSGDLSGTLESPTPDHVATFGLSGKDAGPIIEKLKAGKVVDSIAYIDAEVKQIQTTNIIAQTVEGDPDNCVMLGGHSDSVSEGPGINDDGSGSLTLLEVATQLTNFSVNNCVRFAWWAGEEEGLLGSDYYVEVLPEEENMKIRLFMDYDMMGSPNFAYQVYNATNAANPEGSEELRNLYLDWYADQGLNYTFIPFDGRSDYDAFIRNGIPGGGIATGAEGIKTKEEETMFGGVAGDWYDPCYHQLCDDTGNVNSTAWLVNTKVSCFIISSRPQRFIGPYLANSAYSSLPIPLLLLLSHLMASPSGRRHLCRVPLRSQPNITVIALCCNFGLDKYVTRYDVRITINIIGCEAEPLMKPRIRANHSIMYLRVPNDNNLEVSISTWVVRQ